MINKVVNLRSNNLNPGVISNEAQPSTMKTIYSSNTFSLDRLLYDDKQMGFYDYDYHKKLYAEMELFLKLSLYGDGDSILRKLSFNRPEFKKIFNIESLTEHMNLNDHVDVKDTFTETDLDFTSPNFDLTEKRFLFGSPIPLESKAAILFFGTNNLKVGPRLFEHIYRDLSSFENEVLKVENMKFRVEFIDKELDKTEGSSKLEFRNIY